MSPVNAVAYTSTEKDFINWSLSVGTLVGTFPLNFLFTKYGARWLFFLAGTMSALSTVVMPITALFDLKLLLALRFLQGLAFGANFGVIGILCVRWAPISETSIFISVLTSFTFISSLVTNQLSAWLCNTSFGWPSAFYCHAAFGFLVFSLWVLCYGDDPQLHPMVGEKELLKIQEGKTKEHIQRDAFVPYKEIIKNKVILIVWLNAFAEMTTMTFLLPYAATYFNSVLGFRSTTAGTLSALVSATHLPLKFVFGIISDKLKCISERSKMWIFNTIAVGLAGVFCALIGVFSSDWSITGFIMYTIVLTCMGLNVGGFYRCGTLCARQYSHFVLTVIQFMKCIGMFVGPLLHLIFVSDEKNYNQWRYTYWVQGALLLIANFMFIPIATDQAASFTHITRSSEKAEGSDKT
ncbi:hypothetical protein ANCCAN_16747 [Ancylostoma caninum]|uniref:Major facilitator superfamily (MFS) profile domain-containing protein n=1 Tax=Ancylostoma caninum TaxID=29170 RepID=A0A368G302_ANCCA|nr:hypothetical protein ANCCAN_16747 [Ancylostoma caninum]